MSNFYIEYETTSGKQTKSYSTGEELRQFIMENNTTFINHCKVVAKPPEITDCYYLFMGCSATSLDLSSFNTSNVTDMAYMFYYCSATTLDLSSFNTSNVTDMGGMFSDCSVTSLDLSSFDTSNVISMMGMFSNCSVTSLDLSSFDTASVTYMRSMFSGTQNLSSIDLSSFDTSNVSYMEWMFSYSQATTGYARTQADADRLNASSNKPAGLTFTVKEPEPEIIIVEESETNSIPYETVERENSELEKGVSNIVQQGVNGIETTVYSVTYTNGVETDREVVSVQVTKEPINEIIEFGTYVEPSPTGIGKILFNTNEFKKIMFEGIEYTKVVYENEVLWSKNG